MNSLKTDDIIGAMPRIRHMPKNLLRQHTNYPYSLSTQLGSLSNLEKYQQNLGGKWDHSYNTNVYGNFPLSQYDPNPFIKEPSLTRYQKSLQKSSYEMPNYQNLSKTNDFNYNLMNSSLKSNQYKNYPQSPLSQRKIHKKQALITNYDQLKQYERVKNTQNIQMQYERNNPQDNSKFVDNKNQASRNELHHNVSLNSAKQFQKSHKKQQHNIDRNIFRGLGFNIITNSKYQFNLETRHPYEKKVAQDNRKTNNRTFIN